MPRLRRLNALIDDSIGSRLALRLQCLEAKERNRAGALHVERLTLFGLEAPSYDRLKPLCVAPGAQGLHQFVHLATILDEDDGAARVCDLVCGGVRGVRRVKTGQLTPCKATRQGANEPLGRVEAPDVHCVELLEAESDQALCGRACVLIEVGVCPRGPVRFRQCGGRLAVLTEGRTGPLYLEDGLLSSCASVGGRRLQNSWQCR
mmetsp:Transcript_32309/g.68824  ORF Transcript_32309/g.68824 Transcript_32309/m.68824 type:complete len:205 (-) Transcript_32309:258-872(-)